MENKVITLFDNTNINYDEYYNEFIEFCEENDIDYTKYPIDSYKFYEWVHETISMEYNDFMTELKYDEDNNVECVVLGYVGRWNGTFEIAPHKFCDLKTALEKCIGNCDYFKFTAENGIINVISIHHDASNHFTIHKLNKRGIYINDTDKLYKEYYHTKFNFN